MIEKNYKSLPCKIAWPLERGWSIPVDLKMMVRAQRMDRFEKESSEELGSNPVLPRGTSQDGPQHLYFHIFWVILNSDDQTCFRFPRLIDVFNYLLL